MSHHDDGTNVRANALRAPTLLQFIDSDAPAAAAVRPHRQAMLDYRRRYGA